MKRKAMMLVLLVAALAMPAWAGGLQKGDAVAICGDSITEQKLYSIFIEDYLLMCQPAPQLRTIQFGWGGETAPGFLWRMGNDALWFKPTVATTCYGMNDGGYSPMDEAKAHRYKTAQQAIVRKFKEAGVRLIAIGSPGVVDADTFHNSPAQAVMYNKTLAALRDIARQVAQEEQVAFANVFDPMMDVMTQAKAKYGNKYHVAGGDGVHPASNGHLVMAYAFLKAIGCDGNIGTITLDLASGKAEATDGHRVLAASKGAIEIESSRYPFCFFGDPASPASTRGVIEFFPFNEELNRFRLVVTNASAARLKVTWGSTTREYAAADLAKGINLAAEFLDNPFCENFSKVEQAIRTKQNFETPLHKELLHSMGNMKHLIPDATDHIDALVAAGQKRQKELSDTVTAAVTPVRHTIKVEAAQ